MSMTRALDNVDHVVVERWRLNGTNRAYVTVAGEQVGFRDLSTGSVHCADARFLGVLIENTEGLLSAAPTLPSRPLRPARPARAARPARHDGTRQRQRVLLPDRDLATRPEAHDAVASARRLLALPLGWHGLHAVPLGEHGSDVDHLVIGPGGVFTVDVNHHPDASVWVRRETVRVDGHNQSYVRDGRVEAKLAGRLLTAKAGFDVPVKAVVAVAGAQRGFAVRAQPTDGAVVVVLLKTLAQYLRTLPAVLDAETVDRLYDAARHLATWQPSTVEWTDFRTCRSPTRRASRHGRGRPSESRHRRSQLTSQSR
jgi:hypothetical protein